IEIFDFSARERESKAPCPAWLGPFDTGLEADVSFQTERVGVVLKIASDQVVLRIVRVVLGHWKIAELHALARCVDVERAIRAALAVLVLEHPVAPDA